MINRCAVSVRAKQPFLDWLDSLPDMLDFSLEEINRSTMTYLLPKADECNAVEDILRDYHDLIFEDQLAGYWTNEEHWPEIRNFEVFMEWFDCSLSDSVRDLCPEEPMEWD